MAVADVVRLRMGIVKLTKTRLIDPQDDGLEPVVNRVCRGSVSPISLNLTIPSNGFVRHDDAAFGQQILDIPGAQAVSVVHPHGVADDVRRKAMPEVAGSTSVHPSIVSRGELT